MNYFDVTDLPTVRSVPCAKGKNWRKRYGANLTNVTRHIPYNTDPRTELVRYAAALGVSIYEAEIRVERQRSPL